MTRNDNLSNLLPMTYYMSYCCKYSNDFIYDLNYYVLCILSHSRLLLSIFGKLRDSLGNTTLLGDFSHPIFLEFPDSKIRHNDGDKSSTRTCSYEEVDYVVVMYFVDH